MQSRLSQRQLADRAGVEAQTISNLETGRTTGLREWDAARKLAHALELPVEELIAPPGAGTKDDGENARRLDIPVRQLPVGERLAAQGKRQSGELRYDFDEGRTAPVPVAHPNHVCARLDGDCMLPEYESGMLVVCDAED